MTGHEAVVADIRTVVSVKAVDEGRARGQTGDRGNPGAGLFGGQMIAQSLAACAHTVPPGAVPDSIHANLLRTGRSGEPVEFRIERIRDGRSLQHREVRGYQGDDLIVQAMVVSSIPAGATDWQRTVMPDVAPPARLADSRDPLARHLDWGVFEVVHPTASDDEPPPRHPLWVRTMVELPDDPWLHGAVRAFWSDFGMNWAARATHNEIDPSPVASLSATHSVWFHRHRPVHDWHLLDVHTTSLAGNQGFVQASLFGAAGSLVASILQGVYVRHPGPQGPGSAPEPAA